MENVAVLMSTYNGEKYLSEQIDSIMNQKDVNVYLLIRDDGSTDKTIEIIKEYQNKYDNIAFYSGENLKPAKSFMDLVLHVDSIYDYYAFSDQDDIWFEKKLINGINEIKKVKDNIPVLSYCDIEFVNEKLEKMDKVYGVDVNNANSIDDLIYSFGMLNGCTMILNKKLCLRIKEYMPNKLNMHDKWIHLVCLYIGGKVVKDNNVEMLYRRLDSGNETGKKSLKKRFSKFIHYMNSDDKCKHSAQLKEIIDNYDCKITNNQFLKCQKLADYKKKFKYRVSLLLNRSLYSSSKKSYLDLKFRILMGIF